MLVLLRLLTHRFVLPGFICCMSQSLDLHFSISPLCRFRFSHCSPGALGMFLWSRDRLCHQTKAVQGIMNSSLGLLFPYHNIGPCFFSQQVSAGEAGFGFPLIRLGHNLFLLHLISTFSIRFSIFMGTCNTQNKNWKLNEGPPILQIVKRGWRIICQPHY